ncbi:MAG: permease [Pirellulaceae bacterium]|nr:MAG: permease [Pirellulaceae bacterium]
MSGTAVNKVPHETIDNGTAQVVQSMLDTLYLATRYLLYHRWRTVLLVASMAVVFYLPSALQVLVVQARHRLMERARLTPLLLGARGSPLELVLNSLYFDARIPPALPAGAASRLDRQLVKWSIPLFVRFQARGYPIVGTSLDYFTFRQLALAEGRWFGMLGECVIGSEVARRLNLAPGDILISTPESISDLAGVYPLKMHVVGVLRPTGNPDDRAVFVDVKTSWVIAGLGHGHQDLLDPEAQEKVLSRTDSEITANASVVQYNEITPENISQFHFHGDADQFPLTAILVVPHDDRAGTLLLGRFTLPDDNQQLIVPEDVISQLMETVFTVKRYVLAGLLLVVAATLLAVALIFSLTVKLRRREIETLVKLGTSPSRIRSILGCEMGLTVATAVGLAGLMTLVTGSAGNLLLQLLIRV